MNPYRLNLSLADKAAMCATPRLPNTSVLLPTGDNGTSPALPIFSMTLGAVSNVLALALLAQVAGRMWQCRSAATFLLFVASLLAIDLAGHVILGALVLLRLYTVGRAPAGGACHFLGSCMVFFGLCPLLLGCGMAVERCVGVTQPLIHAARVSVARARLALAVLAAMALAVALLPLVHVGRYKLQYPGTWCFISLGPHGGWRQALLAGLGLAALLAALVCNMLSGLALFRARWRQRCSRRFRETAGPDDRQRWGSHGPCLASALSASSITSATATLHSSRGGGSARRVHAHDVEMVGQLVGIMVVSCTSWSPLLVLVVLAIGGWNSNSVQRPLFLVVCLASWNQILDP
ncbi:prostaglandin E2 receptor EP1 subtype-like [Mus pahari]|uniref:prostaglandin E2 receptor EP1 subtype-like n=1 Tax=Mus pahari TaxID=10093 RepID=UPI000A310E52|nr:prostaglandin E2 receptor EP1 subtype-like [Mus pahari]